jgi:hypothetical protein
MKGKHEFPGRTRISVLPILVRLAPVSAFLALAAALASAQSCTVGDDLDPSIRSAVISTAQRYFDLVARGDSESLRQNSIPSLAANFAGIAGAVKDNQSNLTGAKAEPRSPFLLKAEGTAPLEHAEFLCGVFGANGQTKNSAVFQLGTLPPGTYAVAILDTSGNKTPLTVSMVLQQESTAWKLGGLYIKASAINGHDGDWYANRAREFKAKGQVHNAWFYLVLARDLLSPLPFMSTMATDKLYDEEQSAKPSDSPSNQPLDLKAGTKSYKVTDMFPSQVGNQLDLVVKYQAADISNTAQSFQENIAVIHALVARYPELRDAFDDVVARAVDPSGRDYGTMLPMKEIK